jgi:hypothetical protein
MADQMNLDAKEAQEQQTRAIEARGLPVTSIAQ